MIIRDYLTETQEIYRLTRNKESQRTKLTELYSDSEHLFGKYILSDSLGTPDVVEYLLNPQTQRRVNRFDRKKWLTIGHKISRELKKTMGDIPEPRIMFYPGFQVVNGMVVWLEKKPVIVMSPDFGYFNDENIKVLLIHEYGHFLRAEVHGVDYGKLPLHGLIFEEGLSTYLTTYVWPEIKLPVVFMSNLHRKVGLTDPPGGYVRWCKKHFPEIAEYALDCMQKKESDATWRMFQGGRVTGDESSPVRTGYYLGYSMVKRMAEMQNLSELIAVKATKSLVRDSIRQLLK